MKKTYRNFFYDFDGMLADTYPHIAKSFVLTLKETRGEEIDEQKAFDLFNVSYATAYDYYRVTEEEKYLFGKRNENLDTPPQPTLFPHAEEVLREAKRRGCRNFIYTNRGEFLFAYLKFFGIEDCFEDCIISAAKPNPVSLELMLEKHGIDRGESVVVGDRAIDVEGGRRAGVDGILFNPIGRVKEHCATYEITRIEDLLAFLPQ